MKSFSNALAGYSRRSASTAGLRQLGKTCELQMLGCANRTCAAGLQHSVRPANCKRGPLSGFEVPNVGHPFSFSFSFSFSAFLLLFQFSQPKGLFSSPFGGLQLHLFSLFYFALRLHSQLPVLLQRLFLFCYSGFLCVGNSVTKSACHLCRIAGDHRGPRGAVVNEDPPGKPVQTYLPFFKSYGNQAKPRTWTQSFFHNLFSIAWPGLSQEPQHTA